MATEESPFSLGHYQFEYPPEHVAHSPASPPEAARLLVVQPGNRLTHHHVCDLPRLLPPHTLLVLNDARVFPARLHTRRATGGEVEVLLLDAPNALGQARALLRPARRVKPGEVLLLNGKPALEVVEKTEDHITIRLLSPHPMAWLKRHGSIPLPPYMPDNPSVYACYQTAFARQNLAVAAPTAGLHLSRNLLHELKQAGHEHCRVTLAVGYGTFAPIQHQDIRQHVMHREWYALSPATAATLNRWRTQGRPILAVGTTALRVLESCFDDGRFLAGTRWTNLYLTPQNPPRCGVKLMTNFHLPGTSLLVLLASLLPQWRTVYETAVGENYRLFSFGDAMLIL